MNLLGKNVDFSGYDLSINQLNLFKDIYGKKYNLKNIKILDITLQSIDKNQLPDVVYQSTVLMHIKRNEAYLNGLRNFLNSASKFAVIIDNWNCHNYIRDILNINEKYKLFFYDSGSSIALIVSLNGDSLKSPFEVLTDQNILFKYF
jgi:hypothetical protein